MSGPARPALPALLALGVLAACASVARPDSRASAGPAYGAGAVSRLSFQGVHLGMTQREACGRLLAQGYVRQRRRDCGPHDMADGDDGFLGSAPGTRNDPRPDTPSAGVKFFILNYDEVRGRQILTGISIYTDEPNRADAAMAALLGAWGRPTYQVRYGEHYSVFNYASSRRQADPHNRERFASCQYSPECEFSRHGTDCGAVLALYAGVVAHVVTFDWGRTIEMRDYRPVLRDLRRSGALERRDWERNICNPPSVH